MVRRSYPLIFAALLCPWLIGPVRAQERTVDAPAHISVVDGAAVLQRDGHSETAPTSMPLLAGDRVRTENGRVEVLFDDGSTLHLDVNTTVDFQSDEVVRLLDGRIRLNIAGASRAVSYRIDAPGAWVQISQPGEFRVSLVRDRGEEVELAVLRGAAELVNEDGRTPLRAGERAFAHAGEAPSYAYVFNSAAWDAFDRWSEVRRDQRLALSAQYLPNEVRPYAATFDEYGSWQYQSTYGYVWYPRVSVGWRPYYYGRWASLRPYGWTWIGTDLWSWPTHHYGRWGFSAGVWFWIPGRRWAPAWVSWAYAPGYVSWCPLGWDNRPVIQFVNVNVYGGHRGYYYDPWRAWTVVPQRHFGSGYVNVRVAGGGRVDPRGFRVRDVAPTIVGYAAPRSGAPIRVAGTRSGYASPSLSTPGAYSSRPSDARDSFRNRGAAGGALSGPGFPAPSRAPRQPGAVGSRPGVAVPRDGGNAAGAVPQYRDRGNAAGVPSPSYGRSEGRAVPRDRGDYVPSPGATTPGTRAVPRSNRESEPYAAPGYRGVPAAPRRESAAPAPAAPNPYYGMPGGRAVPRGDGGGYRPPSAPPAEYGGYRSPGPPAGYRSAPGAERGGPSGPPAGYRAPEGGRPGPSGPPAGYRSAPSAPSGPPPSAAPRGGDGSRGGDRPSGGAPAGGRARPRGGD